MRGARSLSVAALAIALLTACDTEAEYRAKEKACMNNTQCREWVAECLKYVQFSSDCIHRGHMLFLKARP